MTVCRKCTVFYDKTKHPKTKLADLLGEKIICWPPNSFTTTSSQEKKRSNKTASMPQDHSQPPNSLLFHFQFNLAASFVHTFVKEKEEGKGI